MVQFSLPSLALSKTMKAPQTVIYHHERPLMTPGAQAAAITLSILGALSLLIAASICFWQRKHRKSDQPDETKFTSAYSLHAPETAYTKPYSHSGHLTRSSSYTTLFGPATYTRPETVSTNRSISNPRVPAPRLAPNPFSDPPRNKAYDVLAGRPRSTTLTNRDSWIENPFRDPASERFDPFGELQQKARRERVRYMEEVRRGDRGS